MCKFFFYLPLEYFCCGGGGDLEVVGVWRWGVLGVRGMGREGKGWGKRGRENLGEEEGDGWGGKR